MTLTISRAGVEAVPEAEALIGEAARWLTEAGMTLWGPEEIRHDDLVAVAKAGELVIGRVGGEAAACMYLHGEDRAFWPEYADHEAFYIHRLAVKRAFAGRRLARAMLAWAEDEARRGGRAFLRLDCVPREKLIALYRAAGFIPADPGPIRIGRHIVIRQQKAVLA